MAAVSVTLLCGFGPDTILAQSTILSRSHETFAAADGLTYAICLGDIDGDGDLDVICGNEDQKSALYLNEGGRISEMPVWESSRQDKTFAVALGDVDRDGDLDLVCGNKGQSNTLYINQPDQPGCLSKDPVWTSSQANDTYAVALGDIDGDGDLDLVCGNIVQGNTLYRNTGTVFEKDPFWTSVLDDSTMCIALGDIEPDGDLDLVCGNDHRSNRLYLNTGTSFQLFPTWSSGPSNRTYGVALGDINGDKHLDLVCGNSDRTANTLYLNDDFGSFEPNPAWWTNYTRGTRAVALGDLDKDGDLDLVCGNIGNDGNNTVYLNDAGGLLSTPGWESLQTLYTQAIALGDMDGDGDLDLVCGNVDNVNTHYTCLADAFQPNATWTSARTGPTRCVALADIDGDGNLDIICGNDEQGNTLFLNNGTAISPDTSWTSIPENSTLAIAVGDVNGDDRMDLVCGNRDANNTLYLNDGGTLSRVPAWTAGTGPSNYTRSLALGDINEDGWPDLVCGNDERPNLLYLNVNGMLSADSTWSSVPFYGTASVALGDMDGDFDLDLVCGNYWWGHPNTIYRNVGGTFTPDPVTEFGEGIRTRSVALGDVDGDGDLDVVCGNDNESNTLYLNHGNAELSALPDWESVLTQATSSVILKDIDGDGDLDLLCSNFEPEEHTTLYLNQNGSLSSEPIWYAPPTDDIVLDDMDHDGDWDLVCGRFNAQSWMYSGAANPVFAGNPADPASQLPNNGAYLLDVAIEYVEENLYRVHAVLHDVESDSVWIVPEYQYEGEPQWYPAVTDPGRGRLGPFAASPAGSELQFDWHVGSLFLKPRDVVLRLRAISNPSRVAVMQHVGTYLKNVGRLDVRRPQITLLTTSFAFEAVTVGDTLYEDFDLTNTGNRELYVTSMEFPSDEMRTDPPAPFTVLQGDTVELRLFLEPEYIMTASGEFRIASNDPTDPLLSLPVAATVLGLDVSSRLLAPAPEVPLGQAITVIVEPAIGVHVESGHLFFRPMGSQEAFRDSVALVRSEGDFIGVIPNPDVTEAGVEYYIRVVNSGVEAFDPPEGASAPYQQLVQAPREISAAPQPNEGSDFWAGKDITFLVPLKDGIEFVAGTLHYRLGGEIGYRSQPLQIGLPYPYAVVPDSLVGECGLEYWIRVETLTQILTDPPDDPESHPHMLQLVVPQLAEQADSPARTYRMVSIPLDYGEDYEGTLETLLWDQQAFRSYDPTRWRCFRYLPATGKYLELPNDDRREFTLAPGKAFWLISSQPGRIDTYPEEGHSTPTDRPAPILLEPGYNQIGNPFAFPVAWSSVLVNGLQMAQADSLIEPPLEHVNGGYRDSIQVLEPFAGYWVLNKWSQQIPVLLEVSPVAAGASAANRAGPVTASAPAEKRAPGWTIRIHATAAGASDRDNVLGVHIGAESHWDRYDRFEPPMIPGQAMSLYFPHENWVSYPGRYRIDLRGDFEVGLSSRAELFDKEESARGHEWRFDLAKNYSTETAGDEVVFEFLGLEEVPPAVSVVLLDRNLLKLVDLREEGSYRVYLGRREFQDRESARFALLAGDPDYVDSWTDQLSLIPARPALRQNYPNPFNPSTMIRYDVARQGFVSLRIYDITGSLVKTLLAEHCDPGRYEIIWKGKDANGRSVAAGLYFSRFETGAGYRETRKMLLVK